MSVWTLIVFIHVGMFGNTDSVALTEVSGFKSEAACKAAGERGNSLVAGTKKDYAFICVEVK